MPSELCVTCHQWRHECAAYMRSRAVRIAVMVCRYVTEGQFRVSHRAEPERPDPDDARSAATLPGAVRAAV